MVEFALIAPIVFLMIFGMIWGGIMFMEYMHYSNAVRTAARQVAVLRTSEVERNNMMEYQKNWLAELWTKEVSVKLYQPTTDINIVENYADTDTEHKNRLSRDVVVDVTFVRVGDIPVILDWVDFPPKYIKALQYRMRVEETVKDTSE